MGKLTKILKYTFVISAIILIMMGGWLTLAGASVESVFTGATMWMTGFTVIIGMFFLRPKRERSIKLILSFDEHYGNPYCRGTILHTDGATYVIEKVYKRTLWRRFMKWLGLSSKYTNLYDNGLCFEVSLVRGKHTLS